MQSNIIVLWKNCQRCCTTIPNGKNLEFENEKNGVWKKNCKYFLNLEKWQRSK